MGGLMTIQDLGSLGELLGSVAVLATLIYLALQTRQNTMAISAQLDAAVLTANQGVQLIVPDRPAAPLATHYFPPRMKSRVKIPIRSAQALAAQPQICRPSTGQ